MHKKLFIKLLTSGQDLIPEQKEEKLEEEKQQWFQSSEEYSESDCSFYRWNDHSKLCCSTALHLKIQIFLFCPPSFRWAEC